MNQTSHTDHYQTVIIGGGIVGCAVFRELAGHNVSTLLIDKFDFCSQTSASSSKMLHGGIRYLENMDFPLVYEALHEKNLWLEKVPHLAKERSFYLPVFKDSLRPLWMVNVGLWLYDFLSSFKNSPHSTANSEKVKSVLKGIKKQGLTGAGVYFDSVVDDIKLGLELVYEGVKYTHADARNYHELEDFEILPDNSIKVTIKNTLENYVYKVTCDELVFTTGPFTDKILNSHKDLKWKKKMVPSKGSHIWLKKESVPFDQCVVLTPNDGRVIFLIPYDDKVLVGTTEVPLKESEFNIQMSQEEEDYLLKNLNEFFPELNIQQTDILSSFAGIRPLVKEDSDGPVGKVARVHKYYQPRSNIHVMIGGKYTTFRVMAMDLNKVILNKLNITHNEEISLRVPSQKSIFSPFRYKPITQEMVLKSAKTELPKSFEDLVVRRMGIFSRSHWREEIEFDEFFLSIKEELSKYITISENEIRNFR